MGLVLTFCVSKLSESEFAEEQEMFGRPQYELRAEIQHRLYCSLFCFLCVVTSVCSCLSFRLLLCVPVGVHVCSVMSA